jgi:hypothetical protein
VGDDLMPFYQDVHDQALRAGEWIDSLRDLVPWQVTLCHGKLRWRRSFGRVTWWLA